MDMTNAGSRAPACPPFITALCERGPTVIHDRRPRSRRGSDRFPDPKITFLTLVGSSNNLLNVLDEEQGRPILYH
jgi:hypothetical protein